MLVLSRLRVPSSHAGFVGGLCIAFDDKERRRALGLYFFFRSLYLCIRIAMRWGWLPRIRNLSVWLFGLANGPIMYSFLYDPKYLDKVLSVQSNHFALNCIQCIRECYD